MEKIKNVETLAGAHTHTGNLLTEKNKLNKVARISLKKCKFC